MRSAEPHCTSIHWVSVYFLGFGVICTRWTYNWSVSGCILQFSCLSWFEGEILSIGTGWNDCESGLGFCSRTSHPEHLQKLQGKLVETFETVKLLGCVWMRKREAQRQQPHSANNFMRSCAQDHLKFLESHPVYLQMMANHSNIVIIYSNEHYLYWLTWKGVNWLIMALHTRCELGTSIKDFNGRSKECLSKASTDFLCTFSLTCLCKE